MVPTFNFKDNEYPFTEITHTREIVRAILLDEQNRVCLEKIFDDDGFGHRDYYETPGGGVNKEEDFKLALVREIEEEVGLKCEVLSHIGDVNDFYNLIKRENHNHYYFAKVTGKGTQKLEPDELKRIEKIIWVSIDEAIDLYEHMQDELVGKLVKQRELPILKLAKSALQSKI